MDIVVREMTMDDYEAAYRLWERSEGVDTRQADSAENIRKYLDRNRGCSFVAESDGQVVGTVLCGHDGRRGYIYHLAVAARARNRGIGKRLVEKSLAALQEVGIGRCHLFVRKDNLSGKDFWLSQDWIERSDLDMMTCIFPAE